MSLKRIESFGEFQGQIGATLRSSLAAAGFTTTAGVAAEVGRYELSSALKLQPSPGESGTSWSARTTSITADINASAYGVDRIILVGDGGNMYASADTISWLKVPNTSVAQLNGVHHANGLWVVVGDGIILTSTDGENFTERTLPDPEADLRAVHYGDGKWVAAGVNGVNGYGLQSTDGISWTMLFMPAVQPLHSVLNMPGHGWIFGGEQQALLTSPDLVTFTPRTLGGATDVVRSFAFNGTTLITNNGTTIRSSIDFGVNWAAVVGFSTAMRVRDLAFSDGRWTAAGHQDGSTNGRISTSTNGTTWAMATITSPQIINTVVVGAGAQGAWVAGANLGGVFVSLGPPTTVTITFTSTSDKVTFGFAFKSTQRGPILKIKDVCDINWPAKVDILGTLSVSTPVRNVWYYYELTIDKTANTINLHTNDTDDLTVALPAPAEAVTSYELTWTAANGAVVEIADLYFLDNSAAGGETLIDRLGPIRLQYRVPTSDILTQWTSTEPGSHASVVGSLPPDLTNYISSNTSGKQDLFASSTPLPAGAGTVEMPIIAVGLVALAAKTDLDNRQLGLAVGQGVSQLEVIDTTLSIDPQYSYAVFEKAPGDVAWTAANAVSEPFGVIVRP